MMQLNLYSALCYKSLKKIKKKALVPEQEPFKYSIVSDEKNTST